MACKDIVVCLGHILILSHRFRWVYCQLEVLRQCFPSSVRGVVAELPESLDETYERILQQIPKPIRVHAHRLLQCLVVAARPLNVEELAEVLAIDFSGTRMTPVVDENLRWEDKERAMLSACSSLIIIVQDWGSRLVQFSHFSVKEFLTSDRLAATTVDTLSYHHIRLEAAHMMMAQVCLSVLLRLDDHMDSETIRNYPLSNYAGKHFTNHVEFENVISSIHDGVDKFLDRDRPHFYTWLWLQIGDWDSWDWDSSVWDSWNWHNSEIDRDRISYPRPATERRPKYGTPMPRPPRLPPLYYVAALGHLCLTRHLILESSQDLDVKDDTGCTPLHMAVLAGKEEVSQLLIKHSVDLNIEDINDRTPLHTMAYMGLSKTVLERGGPLKARLNVRDKNSWTPLHLASELGHSGITGSLLKFGAEVDAQDKDGMTPLHLLSQDRHPLLSLIYQTPLHLVSQDQRHFWGDNYQNIETAQQLLEHGASAHVRNKNGQMPLHLALHHGLFSIVALLLKFGADVDAPDHDTMTPLHLVSQALSCGGSKTAQLLLEHGASVHVRNKNGQTPLHVASHHRLFSIVALLVKCGADVDAQDNHAMTPLHLVSQHLSDDGPKTAQLLLEHGASVQVRNKNGQAPLHLASHHGIPAIVGLLLKFDADVDALDNDSMTPLLLVSQHPSDDGPKTAQLLLEHGASVQVRNKNGQMPLHLALYHGLFSIVALLVESGADVDALDNHAMTPLLLTLQDPYYFSGDRSQITKTTQLLLEHEASVHVRNKIGRMPLHLASHHRLFSIVALLLKFGADVDAQDHDSMTPLHLVSQPLSGDGPKTAQLLLEHGASVHERNENGQMPLHLASHHGLFSIVALLLKFGADVDALDNNALTPLLLVSQHLSDDGSKTAQLLLEHGASVQKRNKNDQTPLHLASHHGIPAIVGLLLKFGADVDALDNDSMTPLFLVSQHLSDDGPQTAQLLLEHGASVHVRNKNGQMPLHLASRHSHSAIVGLLLKFGADVEALDKDTMTPLLLVSQGLHRLFLNTSQMAKTAQLLLEHGASVYVRNKNGQTPLHLASRHDLTAIVGLLLKSGADVDAQDNNSMTPLLLASQYVSDDDLSVINIKVIKPAQLLLKRGASVHVQNKNGQMPLHLASQHGLSEVVKLLLESGADVDARDNSNLTPLHFAVSSPLRAFRHKQCGSDICAMMPDRSPTLESIVKTIKLLLRHGANLQMQNDEGETPLQVALRRREREIIDVLSSHDV